MYILDRNSSGLESALAETPARAVKPPLQRWDLFVARALDVLNRQQQVGNSLSTDQTRRLACLLRGTLTAGFDDRFVNYWDLNAFIKFGVGSQPDWNLILQRTTTFLDTSRNPGADDRFVLKALELMDQSIVKAIKWINMQYANNALTSTRMETVHDWIAKQQQKPNNVYACYRST